MGDKPKDFEYGELNKISSPIIPDGLYDPDTATFDQINRERQKNKFTVNSLKNRGRWLAVVLRVESDAQQAADPDAWFGLGSAQEVPDGTMIPTRQLLRVMIPEIHPSPVPEILAVDDSEGRHQGRINNFYPVVVAESTSTPRANVGDKVWVRFEDFTNLKDGVYLGPVFGQPTELPPAGPGSVNSPVASFKASGKPGRAPTPGGVIILGDSGIGNYADAKGNLARAFVNFLSGPPFNLPTEQIFIAGVAGSWTRQWVDVGTRKVKPSKGNWSKVSGARATQLDFGALSATNPKLVIINLGSNNIGRKQQFLVENARTIVGAFNAPIIWMTGPHWSGYNGKKRQLLEGVFSGDPWSSPRVLGFSATMDEQSIQWWSEGPGKGNFNASRPRGPHPPAALWLQWLNYIKPRIQGFISNALNS